MLLFRANDPNSLWQVLPQRVKVEGVDRIEGYRYPAPGSQKPPRIPTLENEAELYDIKFYSKDRRNLPKEVIVNYGIHEFIIFALNSCFS